MIAIPHDTTDVLLAPVALSIDQQLEQLAPLDQDELRRLVEQLTDRDPTTPEQRRELLLEGLAREVDRHHWELSWHERGLCLRHETRRVVLGLPESVRTFLRFAAG